MLTSTFGNALMQLLLGLLLIFGCIDDKLVRWMGEDLLEERSGLYIKYGVRKSYFGEVRPILDHLWVSPFPKWKARDGLGDYFRAHSSCWKGLVNLALGSGQRQLGHWVKTSVCTGNICSRFVSRLWWPSASLGIKSKKPPEECPSGDVNQRYGQRNKSTLCTSLRNMHLFLSCHGWFWSGLPGSLTSRNLATGSIKLDNGERCTNLCKNNSWLCAIWRQSKNHHVHWGIKWTNKKKNRTAKGNSSDYSVAVLLMASHRPC